MSFSEVSYVSELRNEAGGVYELASAGTAGRRRGGVRCRRTCSHGHCSVLVALLFTICVIVHGAADSKRLCGSPSAIGGIVPSVCRAVWWCSLLDRL